MSRLAFFFFRKMSRLARHPVPSHTWAAVAVKAQLVRRRYDDVRYGSHHALEQFSSHSSTSASSRPPDSTPAAGTNPLRRCSPLPPAPERPTGPTSSPSRTFRRRATAEVDQMRLLVAGDGRGDQTGGDQGGAGGGPRPWERRRCSCTAPEEGQ